MRRLHIYIISVLLIMSITTVSFAEGRLAPCTASNGTASDLVFFDSVMMRSVSSQVSSALDLTTSKDNRAVLAALLTLEYKVLFPDANFNLYKPMYISSSKQDGIAALTICVDDGYVMIIYKSKPLSTSYAYLNTSDSSDVKTALGMISDSVWTVEIDDFNEKMALLVDQLS